MLRTSLHNSPQEARDCDQGQTASLMCAALGALVSLHSFLALAIAISTGPFVGSVSGRQLWFGCIMATTGTAIATLQIRLGRLFIHCLPKEEGPATKRIQHVIFINLPSVLLCFWIAIWMWLLISWR